MEQELPVWLNDNFLTSALQGEEEHEVTIVKFSASLAVAAGNNYMSNVYKVHVEYTTIARPDSHFISLIIKMPISKGVLNELENITEIYAKEPRFYCELLPRMNNKISCKLGPNYFNCPIKNGMILEDLKEQGYVMCDKHKQLDFSHCKCVLTTLAKFHAASVACYRDVPEIIEEIGKEQFFTEKNKVTEMWLQPSMKATFDIMNKIGCKAAADLFFSRPDIIAETSVNLCNPRTNGLNVLNHGDLWVNNMLFKHNESGEVADVKFIDFQMVRFASPVPDLLYFIWTSADEEVREHRQWELYTLYRQTLNTTLELLGCQERLSEQELEDDLRAASDFAIATISGTLPFIMCESDASINMEDIQVDDFKADRFDETFSNLYNSNRFKAILPNIMKQLQAWISS